MSLAARRFRHRSPAHLARGMGSVERCNHSGSDDCDTHRSPGGVRPGGGAFQNTRKEEEDKSVRSVRTSEFRLQDWPRPKRCVCVN